MYNLKVLRAYKLQLKELGYIANKGNIESVDYFRSHLRSGKQPQVKQYRDDRDVQHSFFLNLYFNNKSFSIANLTYKAILHYLITDVAHKDNYFKCVVRISRILVKLKILEVYKVSDNETLIKDNKHNKLFMFKDGKCYRLINNKIINFRLI